MIDEKIRWAKAKKDLSALCNPAIAPLIDKNKLIKSGVLSEICEMALSHSINFGDNEVINRVIDLVRRTKHEEQLALWFCKNAGLKVVIENGVRRVEKSHGAERISVSLASILPLAAEAAQTHLKAIELQRKLNDPKIRVEKKSHKSGCDLLDSRARLPGSFGAGKRR